LPPYLVTEICCALQAAYPAGDGSVAILRSMPPNNRRVSCPSANSNLCGELLILDGINN